MKKFSSYLFILIFCQTLTAHQGLDENQKKFYVSPGAILERNYMEVIGEASKLITATSLQIICQYRIETESLEEAMSKFTATQNKLEKSMEKLEGRLNINPIELYKIQPNRTYNKETRRHEQVGIILTSDFQLQIQKVGDNEIISKFFSDINGLTMMKSEFLFTYTDEAKDKLRELATEDAFTKIGKMAEKLKITVGKAFQIIELDDFAIHYTSQFPHVSFASINPWERLVTTRIRISVEIE